jgi:hypothetical protein
VFAIGKPREEGKAVSIIEAVNGWYGMGGTEF